MSATVTVRGSKEQRSHYLYSIRCHHQQGVNREGEEGEGEDVVDAMVMVVVVDVQSRNRRSLLNHNHDKNAQN